MEETPIENDLLKNHIHYNPNDFILGPPSLEPKDNSLIRKIKNVFLSIYSKRTWILICISIPILIIISYQWLYTALADIEYKIKFKQLVEKTIEANVKKECLK